MIHGELTEKGFSLTINSENLQRSTSMQERGFTSEQIRIRNRDIIAFLKILQLHNKPGSKITTDLNDPAYGPDKHFNYQESLNYNIDRDALQQVSSPYKNILAEPGIIDTITDNFAQFISFLNWCSLFNLLNYNAFDDHHIDAASTSYMWLETGNRIDLIATLLTKENRTLTLSDYNNELAIKIVDKTNLKYQENIRYPDIAVSILKEYIKVIQNTKKDWMAAIQKEKDNSRRAKESGINESLQIISSCTRNGWIIENIGSNSHFVYHALTHRGEPIYATRVVDGHTSKVYDLPEDLRKMLYITDIAVPVYATIGNTLAKGFHSHLNASSTTSWGNLCCGDLGGKPITQLNKLTEIVQSIYSGSMYGGKATRVIDYMYGQLSEKDFPKDEHLEPFLKYKGFFLKKEITEDSDGEVFRNKCPVSRAVFNE